MHAQTHFAPSARSLRLVAAMILIGLAIGQPAHAGPHVMVDVATGSVLSADQPTHRWHPASLTKVMTAFVAFEMIEAGTVQLNSPVRMGANAVRMPPSKMGYGRDTILTLENALKAVIIRSANDVAVAVAESLAGSEEAYVARMNDTARRLGMKNTLFRNPHGLHDPEQVTTARDMAILALTVVQRFPQYRDWFGADAVIDGDRTIESFNKLLGRYPGADGFKTGFVCASGYNQIGSATREGRSLMAVVLGEKSTTARTERLAELFERGFSQAPTTVQVRDLGAQVLSVPPVDQRPVVCAPQNAQPAAESADGSPFTSPYLVEKQGVSRPMRIVTGGADGSPAPDGAIFVAFGGLPVPTPRPDYTPSASERPLSSGFVVEGELRGTIPFPTPRPEPDAG